MAFDPRADKTQPFLDWPHHWDNGPLSHPYGLVEPVARNLFRERLKVMKRVLATTFKLHGIVDAAKMRHRLYHSRSARIAAAQEGSSLSDEKLSELFKSDGVHHLRSFPAVEAPADIWLEGLVPYDYDEDGQFVHVEREVAAFGVGLHLLDAALLDFA
jgi:hypothetical protein